MAAVKKNELLFLEMVKKGWFTVSETGDILMLYCRKYKRNCRRNVLQQSPNGYWFVRFHYEGKKLSAWAHRVVYSYFKGEIPDGLVINHIDGNRKNNNLSNLEAVTQKENIMHGMFVTRKVLYGERHPRTHLTVKDVTRIYFSFHRGWKSANELSREFNISESQVRKIAHAKRWRFLFNKEYYIYARKIEHPDKAS
jgi:hypothetical protein